MFERGSRTGTRKGGGRKGGKGLVTERREESMKIMTYQLMFCNFSPGVRTWRLND